LNFFLVLKNRIDPPISPTPSTAAIPIPIAVITLESTLCCGSSCGTWNVRIGESLTVYSPTTPRLTASLA